MAELQAEFNQQLGVHEPEKIQMAVRVGRAEGAYVAPRRDPADFITDSTTGSDARPSSTAHPGKTPDRRLGRRRRVREPVSEQVIRGSRDSCFARDKEHCAALPLHYLFDAIPVSGSR